MDSEEVGSSGALTTRIGKIFHGRILIGRPSELSPPPLTAIGADKLSILPLKNPDMSVKLQARGDKPPLKVRNTLVLSLMKNGSSPVPPNERVVNLNPPLSSPSPPSSPKTSAIFEPLTKSSTSKIEAEELFIISLSFMAAAVVIMMITIVILLLRRRNRKKISNQTSYPENFRSSFQNKSDQILGLHGSTLKGAYYPFEQAHNSRVEFLGQSTIQAMNAGFFNKQKGEGDIPGKWPALFESASTVSQGPRTIGRQSILSPSLAPLANVKHKINERAIISIKDIEAAEEPYSRHILQPKIKEMLSRDSQNGEKGAGESEMETSLDFARMRERLAWERVDRWRDMVLLTEQEAIEIASTIKSVKHLDTNGIDEVVKTETRRKSQLGYLEPSLMVKEKTSISSLNEQYRREAAISAFGLPSSPRPTKHENTEARKYINEMANDRARRKSYTKTQSVFPTTPKSEYSQVEEMHNLTFGRNSGATNIGKVKAPASVEDLYG